MKDRVSAKEPSRFLAAHAQGESWQETLGEVLKQLGPLTAEHQLGFVYLTPGFAPHVEEISVFLRQTTGVQHWVGSVGAGVVGQSPELGGVEYFETGGVAVLVTDLAADQFRVFDNVDEGAEPVSDIHDAWLTEMGPPLVVAHGDPGNGLLLSLIEDVAEETEGFMVGALGVYPGQPVQIANKASAAGLSGVLLPMTTVPVQTGLTQGCAPIGPVRQVTRADASVIEEIDGRPALEVFKEDIGDLLARDLNRCAGYIFAGLPVAGSDRRDYLVRDVVGADEGQQVLQVAAHLRAGDPILFCRRDPATAVEDMRAMLEDLKRRIGGRTIRGGLYFSCVARGPNQFDDSQSEIRMIEEAFGPIPLVGYFGNGEISHNRLYAYTGVLTLFL